ncbi:protein brother [Cherax quadricarinatus]|uniref:protein brother n=1 Tax=Cherax quadricarinatus TaxID=27406 RepID=UPI00387ED204
MMMNEPVPVSTTMMLPHYESPLPALYEPQPQPPKPRLMFKMPRVVPDQKTKFESDELFRRLARETEVRYTGYRDRPVEERRQKCQSQCRDGYTEIAFVNTGTNLQLSFTPAPGGYSPDVDFNKEPGKVSNPPHSRPGLLVDNLIGQVIGAFCMKFNVDTRARLPDGSYQRTNKIHA